ncbi:MAG: hexokinase [Kiritimatiellaeota bacterium]|nr:hexokinase [Kiritimatiellota bacterium]
MKTPVTDFLARHTFDARPMAMEDLLAEFDRQMEAGLGGRPQSLAMIPAYVTLEKAVPIHAPVVVMDAGGTNLRTAVVWFDEKGQPRIEDFAKYPMPGTTGHDVSAEVFFGTMAEMVAPLSERATAMGFCFSYPAEIQPDGDGRLIRWTKQVRAPEVVGQLIGHGVKTALKRATGRTMDVKVLNDTVATLLAGKSIGLARHYADYVGFILGTGTNTAYVEKGMAINVESGGFDGVPQSDFDRAMDTTLPDCGAYRFEKMISGAYLGTLALTAITMAAAEGLFSENAARAIAVLPALSNKDFDEFTFNPFVHGTALDAVPMTDDDRRTFRALGEAVLQRAAYLAAANIAAAVLRGGKGRDPLHPVCVTVDGSTYYRTKSAQFKSRIEAHIRDILAPRAIAYDIVSVDDAPLVGAAVAGLTA